MIGWVQVVENEGLTERQVQVVENEVSTEGKHHHDWTLPKYSLKYMNRKM